VEREVHDVLAGRHNDGAKQHVGFENIHRVVIDARPPPGMPDVVQNDKSAAGRIGFDHDVGVLIAQDAGGTGSALEDSQR